jgi:hypothetical protein
MTPPVGCNVDELELVRLLDGELTENRARVLTEHAAGCGTCGSRLRAQRALIGRLRAPGASPLDDRFIVDLDRRLDALPRRMAPKRWSRTAVAFSGFTAVAAAAVMIVVALPRHPPGLFTPRGGARTWQELVAVSLSAEQAPAPGTVARSRPLRAKDKLHPREGIVAQVRNGNSDASVHLMVFGVDSADEVHWIQPAWTDPAQNPRSVEIPPGATLGSSPDATAPENPALGRFRVIWIFSRAPLDVRYVEKIIRAHRPLTGRDRQVGSLELEMTPEPR